MAKSPADRARKRAQRKNRPKDGSWFCPYCGQRHAADISTCPSPDEKRIEKELNAWVQSQGIPRVSDEL